MKEGRSNRIKRMAESIGNNIDKQKINIERISKVL